MSRPCPAASGDVRQDLARGLADLGVALPQAAQEQLVALIGLLGRWNRVHNLTAVHTPGAMVTRHLLDSLAALPHLAGSEVLDVGTGAGFPGLPLAVTRPYTRFTLLDVSQKKIVFVQHAIARLGIGNATALRQAVEEHHPARLPDTVLARALAPLPRMIAMVAHLCGPHTRLLAWKGRPGQGELDAVPAGFRIVAVHALSVPGLTAARTLVELARTEAT